MPITRSMARRLAMVVSGHVPPIYATAIGSVMSTQPGRHPCGTPQVELSTLRMATGFLHPGAMGASIAAACRGERLWCGDGRSARHASRAEAAGMDDVGSLDALSTAPMSSSRSVRRCGRRGRRRSCRAGVRRHLRRRQRHCPGNVTGDRRAVLELRRRRRRRPSGRSAGSTRLYLSGDRAASRGVVGGTLLETAGSRRRRRRGIRSQGVLCGVDERDRAHCSWPFAALPRRRASRKPCSPSGRRRYPVSTTQAIRAATGNAPKAWRFAGELDEIADGFAAHDLPDGFANAASDVYQRLAAFKDVSGTHDFRMIDQRRCAAPDGRPPTAPA